MKSTKIPILKTPEAFVMKYLANKIGFNVRPSKVTYDKKTNTYTVNLEAIIPSLVKLENKSSKTFVYTFKNIGSAEVKYEDYDFDFISKPVAPELDNSLLSKFDKLTYDIQKIILDYGKDSWGNLTSIKYWLNPLRSVIVRVLREGDFIDQSNTPRYTRYFEFLKSTGWIDYEKSNIKHVVGTNELTMLHETLVADHKFDINEIANRVIGNIFAKHYDEIKNKLRIFGPEIYVTSTKAYYADAVREGKAITMSQHRLWLKYRSFNYKPRPITHKDFSFPNAVSELVSNNFLKYQKNERFITANNDLLDRLLPYHEKLAETVIEI